MAFQPEVVSYDTGVYQLEVADPVDGGVGAVSNKPLLNLANRTAYLYQHVTNLENGTTIPPTVAPLNNANLTGTPTAPTPALGDSSTKISTTAFVQGTVNGLASVNVAGGANVTLSAVQAGNGILVFTGALTANIAVIVPNSTKTMIVENLTSGAFTLTVKTAAGTGIAVTQGKTQEVFCDGTNVLLSSSDFVNMALTGTPTTPTPAQFDSSSKLANTQFVKQAGFQFSQTVQYSAGPITLTASQAGQLIDLASAYSGQVTLPALSSLTTDGTTFYIWNGASTSVTVKPSGTDLLFVNNLTASSITLGTGDTLIIERSAAGGNVWIAIGGSSQFAFSATFAGLAPKPSSSAGVGQFQTLVGLVGAAATLPSGGTWAYFAVPYNASGQASTSTPTIVGGVAAGGTIVGAATSGFFWYGFAWRVQ
ncbi:MAG TPA: hypothetical protein VF534_01480 [Paraburkholderia sp.]